MRFRISILACALVCFAHASEPYEPEPVLKAPMLVQAALLSGPDFHVVPEVPVRGYMGNFLIDTRFGPLRADSVQMLALRIGELPALDALDRASRSDAFATALAARARKTGAAVVNVFAHPIDTVSGLPEGVARFFDALRDTWSGRAQALSDRSVRELRNAGDPFAAPPGPMTASRDAPAVDAPPDTNNHAWYARAGSEATRESKRHLKFSQQRRELAKALNVDPESSNPLLRERLDELAWAAVWGNFSAGAALGQIAAPVADVVSWSGKLDQYVLSQTPELLRETNERRLAEFCGDAYAVRQFLRRGGFTDTVRTALIESLQRLKPRSGCDALIELATTTRGEVEARYLVDALKLIESQPQAAGGVLETVGASIVWRTPGGKILLPLPLDFLTWNHSCETFLDLPAFRIAKKLALIGGDASITAQRALTARGWGIAMRSAYAGAPAYARFGEFDVR